MYKYIGDRIKKIREQKGMSQKTLGLMLGLSDKAISSYESGRTTPSLETLIKISKELKKPISYFIDTNQEEISLHDKIDKTEKAVKEILEDMQRIKELLKNYEEADNQMTPPNKPV